MPSEQPGQFLGAAFALLFDSSGRFLLLKERPDEQKYMYDLPGGTLKAHEDPVVGLRREVFEESRLEIENISDVCILKWDRHESGNSILVAFYLANAVEPAEVRTSAASAKEPLPWGSPTTQRRLFQLGGARNTLRLRLYPLLRC